MPGAVESTAVQDTTADDTVDGVVARLRALGAELVPADGVAVFNRAYLTVTEAVRERLGGPYFADPAAVAVLDVVFARRYLLAVAADAAGREPPACWRPLFELRAHSGVHPLQFALAGMNAHIQHDLPLAVLDACGRLGCEPEDVEDDYHRVNGVLAEVEAAVREQLLGAHGLPEPAAPLAHLLGAWSVDAAREAAWSAVRALWELRRVPCAAHAFAAALDGSVGLLGRALLLPLGFHHEAQAPDTDTDADVAARTAAGRLPEARNRPADETSDGGGAGGRAARPDQAQLECSGLPSA
ncbi:DUF5995 family protein [Streptomyces sp. SP17BM10]|uniref:DUF5995 family protein n=1 Tax=Streptomyces sp. SP17BM10 TaxID=3002530 RepID=UPI002E7782D0|nr:DUF5995 family protein [Streptomyces sp. SP17BM10]